MNDTAPLIGDLAAGALAARAAESAHGEAADGHTQEVSCLDCGTALIGSYYHRYRQAAHVRKTIAAYFHDLAHVVAASLGSGAADPRIYRRSARQLR